MRTLKLALAAVAALAFNHANAAGEAYNGLGSNYAGNQNIKPSAGVYQAPIIQGSQPDLQAFHAGGVAACDGCHVMHNADGGVAKATVTNSAVAPWTNVTNMFLLQGTDQSSTCLICHGGAFTTGLQFTIADLAPTAAPTNRTPGGDFGWTKMDFNNSPAQRHGHNVAAADFSMLVDPDLHKAPGGTWTGGSGKAQFACSSCHDPHGRYRMIADQQSTNGISFMGPFAANSLPIAASGSYGALPSSGQYAVGVYRLLAGQGYAPVSNPAFPFPNNPPVAVAPMLYNNTEATAEVRVAYGTGMSEWCQNCHTNIHFNSDTRAVGIAGFRHPAGSDATLAGNQINIYNTYLSSGTVDPTMTDNYTSLVPFEQGKDKSLTYLAGKASTSAIAADGSSNVMCLSCHRAHGSAFDSILRWDQMATFLTDSTNYTSGATGSATLAYTGTNGVRTPAITKAGYYDRNVGPVTKAAGGTVIGPYQRSLCNKCHGKD